MEKKPAEEAEAARIARAAEEQRSLAQAEKRGIIREHIVNGRRREALRVLRDMERAQLLPDRKAYAEALIAFTTRPVQHKLVVGLAQLQERVPAPLWPGAASHFLVSAAALGDWREALTWWRKESAGSPSSSDSSSGAGGAPDAMACREAALLSLVRLGRWREAEALLFGPERTSSAAQASSSASSSPRSSPASSPSSTPSSLGSAWPSAESLQVATRECAAAGGPSELARRCFTTAVGLGVADCAMLHDALRASAAAGEAAEGLAILRGVASEAAAAQQYAADDAVPGVHAPSERIDVDADVLRIAARLHVDVGDVDAAIRSLRSAYGQAEGLEMPAADLEAIALACARSHRWSDVRWLMRAALHDELSDAADATARGSAPTGASTSAAWSEGAPSESVGAESTASSSGRRRSRASAGEPRLSPTSAWLGLAACADGEALGDLEDVALRELEDDAGDGARPNRAAPHRARRRALSLALCRYATAVRRDSDAVARGAEKAEMACPPPARPWATSAVRSAVAALLGGPRAAAGEARAIESPYRAVEDAVNIVLCNRAAGARVDARTMTEAMAAASEHERLRSSACRLYEGLAADLAECGALPSPHVCGLALRHYESASEWRRALELPHVSPSAEAFSRGLEIECEQESWLRIAESRRSRRHIASREAAIGRWRERVLRARADRAPPSANLGANLDAEEQSRREDDADEIEALRAALGQLLQLTASSSAVADDTPQRPQPQQQQQQQQQQQRFELELARALSRPHTLPHGVAAKLAYQQLGSEALRRADALLRRAKSLGRVVDGGGYSALVCAHAAMRSERIAAELALEACAQAIDLDAKAYLAALTCVRSPEALRSLVGGMGASARLRWLRTYSDAPVSSILAVAGAAVGRGRSVAALQRASDDEVHAGLQALSMLGSGVGGVSAMLMDLQASRVPVASVSRCMLLTSACLEGWVQQQLAFNLWLPLLHPNGDQLLEPLLPSLLFVPTPPASGFKGAWCFDWRGPETHPVLREWMRYQARTDARFDERSEYGGLCPIDVGVHVLEGMLVASSYSGAAGGAEASPAAAHAGRRASARVWAKQLNELRVALQALIVQYESTVAAAATSAVREGRAHGFMQSRGKAITAPALSAQKGVLRELLTITDLQSGIRYGAQLQTAKVLVVAIEALLAQLASSASGVGGAGGGGGAAARAREPSSGRLTSRRAQSKGGKRRQGMTKRQRRAYDELARGGLVGLGAVDPSPQRTTVAVAACVCLLL